ncbi:Rhs-family protein [Pseudomonas chlororaphis]|uniref:Rhs-family protein n=1 Tax=Pseudomonas chlororaphis TaxID=587753 RepID=A0A3G7TVT3_9PSED|nr:RHS repeat-associated core domain-containing protein [Pseudomonas chlororaphis]AZE50386.1 Rhs-family protein [Pseudomonas chlororaphis]
MSDLAELHQDTPTLMVIGPRGHALRSVSYYRTEAGVTAEARVERQDYDAAGRVIAQWDARLGEEVKNDPRVQANLRMVYSLSGQMLCTDSVDAGRQLSLPGEAGQVVDSWDSKLDHRCIAYDQMLRPVRVYEQAAGQPERRTSECLAYAGPEGASHNQCGQLIRHDDSAGTVHFSEYNLLGAPLEQTRHFLERLEEPDWPAGEVDRDRLLESGTGATTQTGYNAVGEIRSQTDAFGNRQIIYQNVAGQLQETRLKLAGKPEETLVRAISYNAFNQIEQQTAGNGVTTQAIYSALDGRLQQVKTQTLAKAPLQDLNYSYDPLGNITSIKDNAQPIRYFRNQRIEMLNTYKYNTLDQLIEAKGPQAIKGRIGPQLPEFQSPADPNQLEIYTQTFDYDPSGNLDVLRHTAASQNQTRRMGVSKYSNRGLQEKADGSLPTEAEIAAGVDANGNLKVLQPGQTLAWDMRNQLCQVDQVVRDDDAPNDIERYVYDSAGQRQRKIRMAYTGRFSRTHEVRYLPGLEIRTSPGEVLHVISVQAGRSRVEVLHWVEGQPKGIKSNHQQRYSLGDHLGSSTLELDDEAALISQEWFYPYGGTACWAGRDKVEASYKVVRYSGKERDATGLYYYGFRYYAPWLQRWINPDPAGAIDGLNLFRMVRNNPVTLTDPDGKMPRKSHWLDVYQKNVAESTTTNTNNLQLESKVEKQEEHIFSDVQSDKLPVPNVLESKVGGSAMVERIDSERYLTNKGSRPVDIKIMREQVRRDNIYAFDLNRYNAKEIVESIIQGDSRRPKSEYIFALSESKGMRVLTRGFAFTGFKEEALHHQNVFIGKQDILSAGTIYVHNKKMIVTNFSGHFKPPESSLLHVSNFLKESGISKKNFITSDYMKINEARKKSGRGIMRNLLKTFKIHKKR